MTNKKSKNPEVKSNGHSAGYYSSTMYSWNWHGDPKDHQKTLIRAAAAEAMVDQLTERLAQYEDMEGEMA